MHILVGGTIKIKPMMNPNELIFDVFMWWEAIFFGFVTRHTKIVRLFCVRGDLLCNNNMSIYIYKHIYTLSGRLEHLPMQSQIGYFLYGVCG